MNELHIDRAVPKGWGEDYPVFEITTVEELREFLSSYAKIKTNWKVGLDLRFVRKGVLLSLLKTMEDSNLHLVMRLRELVPATILSRASRIYKEGEVVDRTSLSKSLVWEPTKVAEKIREFL